MQLLNRRLLVVAFEVVERAPHLEREARDELGPQLAGVRERRARRSRCGARDRARLGARAAACCAARSSTGTRRRAARTRAASRCCAALSSGMSTTSSLSPALSMRSISLLDDLGFRRHRVHHAVRAAARMRRHLEHVDDGVVDVEIDEILDAPAHGGAQLVGRHVGRFDEQQAVAGGIEHADRRRAPARQSARATRANGSCAPSLLVDAALEPRLARRSAASLAPRPRLRA